MRHVDEGILHAYLDGALEAVAAAGELPDGASAADVIAHFDMCSDCRARLEAERVIRERAGLVLRDIAPREMPVPPLVTPRPMPWRRTVPLAWAATLLLAVGAGWWGNAIWRGQTGAPAASTQMLERTSVEEDRVPSTESFSAEPAESDAPAVGTAGAGVAADAPVTESPPPPPPAAPAPEVARREADVAREATERIQSTPVPSSSDIAAIAPPPAAPAAVAEPQQRFQPLALKAQVSGVPVDTSFAGSFRGFLEREGSGLVPWQLKAPGELVERDVFHVIAGASEPVIERGMDIGAAVIRVRQVLPGGEPVEVITWTPVAVEMEALVVTGAPAGRAANEARDDRARRAEAAVPPVASAPARDDARSFTAVRDSALGGGRHELIGRSAKSWVTIRARLPVEELSSLQLERGPAAR